ncbi:hypothetical protein CAPTEDRAFT_172690 [Capitella teleta]|uniref:Interleukin-1 receptor-associated kinase 1-binding protein 1 n=1 Tax=Capitella teleta TaxID=283909 RepID=R7V9L2_CAPTE|nr:hypothetical protein CAPTEDRAFT_172690 [Capitella teleta]|eukprot:ELU12435.1 hypothetical protein CAPTEDRAFT_172690 [Capitella teleta]
MNAMNVASQSQNASGNNQIQVTATGEVSKPPDRCRVFISVKSSKDQVQDAKNSVVRRLDYVIQTLNNHQIRESEIHVTKVLRRENTLYAYQADITAHFVDFNKCQSICNLLVEKLDESVHVALPEFYHSPNRQEVLRREASVMAAQNAKSKAGELGQFLGARIGNALSLQEESCTVWEGSSQGHEPDPTITNIQQRLVHATLNVCVKVTASFQLKTKSKDKRNN